MRPRQELADDRKVYRQTRLLEARSERGALTAKARPGRPCATSTACGRAEQAPSFERSPASGCASHGDLRFSARHPSGGSPLRTKSVRGRVGNGLSVAHAETTVGTLRFAHPTHYANPGCERIAATKECACMAERHATNSVPPPRGEVRRRLLAASGWGELRRATALPLERDAPHPSVALRAQAAKAVAHQKSAPPDLPARGRYGATVARRSRSE